MTMTSRAVRAIIRVSTVVCSAVTCARVAGVGISGDGGGAVTTMAVSA